MNASQMLRRQIDEPEAEVVTSAMPLEVAGNHYTSDAMEEDFSTAIDLLMLTPKFLVFLQDADNQLSLLSGKSREALDAHLEAIEDFTGQWEEHAST